VDRRAPSPTSPTAQGDRFAGYTPLQAAVLVSSMQGAAVLMRMGADPHRRHLPSGCTAIEMAQAVVAHASAGVKAGVAGSVALRKAAAEVLTLVDTRCLADVVKSSDIPRARAMLTQAEEAHADVGGSTALVNAANE